jgi:hypothetical protein
MIIWLLHSVQTLAIWTLLCIQTFAMWTLGAFLVLWGIWALVRVRNRASKHL